MGIGLKDINGREFIFSTFTNNSIVNNWFTQSFPFKPSDASETDIIMSYGTELYAFMMSLVPAVGDIYNFTLKNGYYFNFERKAYNDNYDEIVTRTYTPTNRPYPLLITGGVSTGSSSIIVNKGNIPSTTRQHYIAIYPSKLNSYDDITIAYNIYQYVNSSGDRMVAPESSENFVTWCENLKNMLTDVPIPTRYDDNYSDIDEGDGDGDNTSDIISQDLNDILSQLGRFANIYQISGTSLNNLYDWLWTDDIMTNLNKMFSSPLDSIISLQIAPFSDTQLPLGTSQNIILANIDTKVQAKPLIKGFIRIDCGTLTLSEYFGNFLDYPPYTQIECYIPYVGYVPLDATDVMSSEIQLYYDIDLVNGFFTANIVVVRDRYDTQLNAILYTYSGSMFYNVPITSADYSAVTNGLINVATNALTGNVAGFAGSAGALLVATSHPNIRRSGSISSNANLVTLRVPHVRITRPRLAIAKTLQQEKGFMCNVTCKLSDLSGYVEVKHVDLTNMSRATKNEKSEIENLLSSGVFI